MIDLNRSDVFHADDILVTVHADQPGLKASVHTAMAAIGYSQYAYSNLGTEEQLLFIKDTDARRSAPQYGSINPALLRGNREPEPVFCAM